MSSLMRKMDGTTSRAKRLEVRSHSPEETQLLGRCLGELVQGGDVLLLEGALGTGKTCLVQGVAHGLGIREYAFSPSFVIVREYHGRLPLHHIDLYRLERSEEIADLGLEEYLYGNGVSVVEWADRGIGLLPQDSLLIRMDYVSQREAERVIRFRPGSQRYSALVEQLRLIRDSGKTWS